MKSQKTKKQPKRKAGVPEWVGLESFEGASQTLLAWAASDEAKLPILLCPNCFRNKERTPKAGMHAATCKECSTFYMRARRELTNELKRFTPADALQYLSMRANVLAYRSTWPDSPVSQRYSQLLDKLDAAFLAGLPINDKALEANDAL